MNPEELIKMLSMGAESGRTFDPRGSFNPPRSLDFRGKIPPQSRMSEGERVFRGLDDFDKSAVTQVTEGAKKKSPGVDQRMLELQRRLTPEQYRLMMEDQLQANETPITQMLRLMGIR